MFDSSGGDNNSRVQEVRKLLELIDGNEEQLSEWEQNFVSDLAGRLEQYEDRTMVSPKQLFALRDIKEKCL